MTNLLHAFRAGKPDDVPAAVTNSRVLTLSIVGAFAAMLFGYDLGFIGSTITLPAFVKDFKMTHMTSEEKSAFSSNVVACFQAGACIGALFSGFLADRIGRRLMILANLFFYCIGVALMTAAKGTTGQALMYAGRAITGWGVGSSSTLVPVWMAECSPPHLRGRLVGMYEVGVQFGTAWGFWIGYAVVRTIPSSTRQWRIPVALQLVPAGIALLGMILSTETPRFIAKSKGEQAALECIMHLRNLPADHPYVQKEIEGIMTQLDHERMETQGAHGFHLLKEMFGRGNRKRLAYGCLLMMFFQMAGTNSVNYYSPRIFASFGLSSSQSSLFATGIYGIIRFLATIVAMLFFTDKFGRVTMLACGSAVMALSMWIVGGLSKAYPTTTGHVEGAQYAIIVFIFVWAVAFCFSYAGIPWVYTSEIFPLRVRSASMSVCTFVHWGFNLMLAKSTPYMLSRMGYGTYFLFAAFTTIGAIWELFCLPETRGVALEDMDELFSKPKVFGKRRSLPEQSIDVDGVSGSEADFKASHEHIEKV